jgi:glycosyltransferase involved in cell wall biosynthesis
VRRPRGVVLLELSEPLPAFDAGDGPSCRLLLTFHGVPVDYLELAAPGRGGGPELTRLLVGSLADELRRREALARRLMARMGVSEPASPPLAVSVVVCTHRRPEQLATLLDALALLNPPPHEIVIVDNAPGELDCRARVAAAGFRYVREDAKGLDRARTTGLHAATGDVVAYTDDDCVPPPQWLARLPRHFADPSVGAVTGPGFAWTLETPAQARFEREDGFRRGLRRRVHTWATLPPVRGTAAGAGANMVFRRELLTEMPDPFPEELDAGTPTQSGGDAWALGSVLAAGGRIVYDPGTWLRHQHRPDPASLHHAIWGYGVGLTSALIRFRRELGEPGAGRAWRWLLFTYLRGSGTRLLGRGDAVRQRLGWDYLRGGLQGPAAYRRSLRLAPGRKAPRPTARAHAPAGQPRPRQRDHAPPELSIVVPTYRRPEALERLLESLDGQEGAPPFEVVLVDDDLDADLDPPLAPPPERSFPMRRLAGGGRGAAAARNGGADVARGGVLLFLDDDMVTGPRLVARHAAAHRAARADRIAVGSCPPRPRRRTLAASAASWWWWDYLMVRRGVGAPTFKDVLSGNMSIKAGRFRDLGGFRSDFGAFRREDWDFGLRACAAGVDVVFADDAVAIHEFSMETSRLLASAYAEGRGDALMARAHPEAVSALPAAPPLVPQGRARMGLGAIAVRALDLRATRSTLTALLDGLEARRSRERWSRVAELACRLDYRRGLRDGGFARAVAPLQPDLVVDVAGDEAIRPPTVLGLVDVHVHGGSVRRLRVPDARWHPDLAREIAEAVPAAELATVSETDEPYEPPAPARDPDVLVIRLPGADAREGRADVEARVAASPCEHVIIALPGVRLSTGWIRACTTPLAAERVAAVHGVGIEPGERTGLDLYSRALLGGHLVAHGPPPQAVALHRDTFWRTGGPDPALSGLPAVTTLLDLVWRLLEAGHVVGSLHAEGLDPAATRGSLRRRAEWQRGRALAVLALRHGRRLGGVRGSAWVLRRSLLTLFVDAVLVVWPGRRGRRMRLLRLLSATHGWLEGAAHWSVSSVTRRAKEDRTCCSDVDG